MKTNGNDNLQMPQHIESEDLIAYLDGEVDRDTAAPLRRHLESCWDCRNRLTSVERSIERFLDLRRDVLLPRELPPSGPAVELFRSRLTKHQALTPAQSFFRRLSWRFARVLDVSNYSLRTQVLLARGLAVIALFAVVMAFVLFSGRLNQVSASELLRRSQDAQRVELANTADPVIHQRITVRSSRAPQSAKWELWNDTVNSRVRNNATIDAATVNDLRLILRLNGMNENHPLSATAYQRWSDSLTAKDESVTTASDFFTIKTARDSNVVIGQIVNAEFTIRADDYHPHALRLVVRTIGGDTTFDLTESEYEVASLRDIDPAIFTDSDMTQASAAPNTQSGEAETRPIGTVSPELSNSSLNSATMTEATASLDTEVEVVKLLDSVGALSGDQINIDRRSGALHISGIVDTAQRKNEILSALAPVRTAPGLVIDIQTAAESAARQKRNADDPASISVDSMRADVEQRLAAEPEIRALLARRGVGTDRMNAEVMAYASSVLDRSRSLRRNALALKQIAERFTVAEFGKLDPAKQAEWRSLLRTKAAAISSDIRSLSGQLSIAGLGDPIAASPTGTSSEVSRSAQQLFNLAAATDAQVSQSFTISSAGNAAVKSQQFWRNLAQMSAIAAEIGKANGQ